MAQTIVVLCDAHLAEDVEVPGLTYRVGINLPSETRWGWFEVDLCPDHAKVLTDLSLSLTDYGRPGFGEGTPSAPTTNSAVCPECGRPFKSAGGVSVHRSRIHGVKGTRH